MTAESITDKYISRVAKKSQFVKVVIENKAINIIICFLEYFSRFSIIARSVDNIFNLSF